MTMDDDMDLIQIKAPKGFIKELDIWRERQSKKVNVPISRPVAMHLLKPIIPSVDYDMKRKVRSSRIIFDFDLNMRKRR